MACPDTMNPAAERALLYREALNEALRLEMRRDERVFCLGVGVAERGGSFKVTRGLLDEFGPRRVFDTPIAEASFTGLAIGAALTGMRPVVEIIFIDFSTLALDQMINQAAKHRFLSGGRETIPLVLRTQGGVGAGLAAQHSQSLEALYYHIPGLRLFMPTTPADAKGLLTSAIRCDDPVVFIEHKRLYETSGPVPEGEYCIEPGKAAVRHPGDDALVIAWSGMVPAALDAALSLADEGISAEVLDLRTLVPLDREAILASAARTGRVVVAQEAVRRGGVASDIASIIQEEAFDSLKAPVRIVAGMNTPIPYPTHLETRVYPDSTRIAETVRELFGGR